MQFNSFVFIMLYLPLTTILYYIANRISSNVGKILLIISSIVFYCYSDVSAFFVLLVSIGINYFFCFAVTKVKRCQSIFLVFPVIINVGLLLYYKYLNFVLSNVYLLLERTVEFEEFMVPLGISFITFQQIAYVVSIYRGELQSNGLLDYLVYILYFPKILMGPLSDPVDFINQINDNNKKNVNWDNVEAGIKIFSLGLFKKVMIADIFAKAVEWGYVNYNSATSLDWLLIMLFYSLEIYFDFSGYSDMAVGTSMLLNITLPINFDSPYKAISIRDFWKRWHISLTRFFTKYIYIPLGGNKKGIFFTCMNTMIVFVISGIWHGANWTFILWGIIHGLLCVFDRIFEKKQDKIFLYVRWLVTFVIVNVLWLLFRSDTIQQWWEILKKMILMQNLNVSDGIINSFNLQESILLSDILGIGCLVEKIRGFWMYIYILMAGGLCLLFENNYRTVYKKSWIMMIVSAIAFVWGVISLSGETVFVYNNF